MWCGVSVCAVSKLRERGRDVQQHIKERQAILASEAAAHQGKAGFLASEAVPFAPAELDHLGLAQRVLAQPEVIRAI